MKALVTGGAGFIGSRLTERLLEAGHDVRVLDNFATGDRSNLAAAGGAAEVLEGDVRAPRDVEAAVAGCEVVFHLAALPSVPRSIDDPVTTDAVNSGGTLNVLTAARGGGARRVVFASSSSVYGLDPELPARESAAPAPVAPYSVSKLAAEGYCRSYAHVHGLETICLRYFNVYGPRQSPASDYAAAVPRFVAAIRSGASPVVYGSGEQSRDFTFVDDAVGATIAAGEAPGVSGRVLNVARGRAVSVNDILAVLGELTGRDPDPDHRPARPSDALRSLADISLAGSLLGYEPRVDIGTGLERVLAVAAVEA
jgi:nucleoside-diphosphate-sugar epimerase